MTEISTKPYLIRALHEWCSDNGYTPYITVVVDEHTVVPREHVQNGQITLNVGTLATNKLVLGNEYIEFQARFGGVGRQISVPIGAVKAIYARETGQGMAFETSANEGAAAGMDDQDVSLHDDGHEPDHAPESRPALSSVPTASSAPEPPEEDPPPSAPDNGARPRLKVIK
nr:ClpXP protease specificity-enhancing factor [Pseudomonas sp.]